MTMQWFIPVGGLRGELRGSEREYLTKLAQLAEKAGKLPVFGEVWSLGRMWAIKQALGGFHIFQYRNLWPQWLSHLWYKQVKGSRTFYCSILDTIFRDDDPYFQWLVEHGLKLANDPHTGQDPKASPLWWNRSYANFERDEDKVRRLELLPEPRVFSLFMGMRVYLYLHAQRAPTSPPTRHGCSETRAIVPISNRRSGSTPGWRFPSRMLPISIGRAGSSSTVARWTGTKSASTHAWLSRC
jgi:hypothetical protein